MIRHTAAHENQRAEGPKAGDLAKPSTAAINQATPPAINNSRVTRKKKFGCVARSCCSSTMRSGNIFCRVSPLLYKKRAPSAHVKPLLGCAQTASNWGRGLAGASLSGGANRVSDQEQSSALLSYMYLFLFVYVAKEIYQTTNKGHYGQPQCDPSQCMTAASFREGHKPVEVIDRADGGDNSHHYRENILQAFHFEPPPNV